MTHYVALLRGINVGGRNRVPMNELKAAMESEGFEDVVTYLQSGNVLCTSPESDESTLESDLEELIAARFGTTTPVIIRRLGELERIITGHPFRDDEDDFKLLHVMFLDEAPDESDVARLDPDRAPGDRFAVEGREIYLHYPNGSGRSKLTIDYFERILGVTATGRNWNTVLRLHDMLRERAGG